MNRRGKIQRDYLVGIGPEGKDFSVEKGDIVTGIITQERPDFLLIRDANHERGQYSLRIGVEIVLLSPLEELARILDE